jgi:hypothetical protein
MDNPKFYDPKSLTEFEREKLLREFQESIGLPTGTSSKHIVRRVSFAEKNEQHEQWHRQLEKFLKNKKDKRT